MFKYLAAFILCSIFWLPAMAEDLPEYLNPEDKEVNAFGYPYKEVIKTVENGSESSSIFAKDKPDCNDARLLEQIKIAIAPFLQTSSASILEQRRVLLIARNINLFKELNPEKIIPKDDREVANRMIELKINNHLKDSNFKVCSSDNPEIRAPLYVLMFDDNDDIRVEIINLVKNSIPSFVFENGEAAKNEL